jgi:hypothetical protein
MNSIRNGTFVPSSEAERFTLHQTLRSLMPEAVADTLMAHLPPAGWSDVARTSDIDAVRAEIDALRTDIDALRTDTKERFKAIRAEIDALRTDMKERFEKVDKRFDKIDERFDRMEARFDELASMKRYVITTGIAIIATIIAMGSPLWFDLL